MAASVVNADLRKFGTIFPEIVHSFCTAVSDENQGTRPDSLTYKFVGLAFHCTWRSKIIPIRSATRCEATFCGSISDMIRGNLSTSNQCFITAAAASVA